MQSKTSFYDCIIKWVFKLCFFVPKYRSEMKSVIAAMLLWIGANTNYNVDIPHPQVLLLPQSELEHKYSTRSIYGELHGFYSERDNTIYLPESFNIYDAWKKGVLFHELVHYVQDMNDVQVKCTAEYEKEAYPLQKQYLWEVHGLNWKYDELWHKLISNCQYN